VFDHIKTSIVPNVLKHGPTESKIGKHVPLKNRGQETYPYLHRKDMFTLAREWLKTPLPWDEDAVYSAIDLEGLKLYPIGTAIWIWEEEDKWILETIVINLRRNND
jgi:hypothetical protein